MPWKKDQESEDNRTDRKFPSQAIFSGFKKRILQALALYMPGEGSIRVLLHRWRGVRIGADVRIGTDVIIETAFPEWVSIGDDVSVGMRCTIIAHLWGLPPKMDEHKGYISVRIEDHVNIGPGVTILPNITIGRGAVITAGSIVTRSVAPLTMVQGNPARPIARCGIPLLRDTPLKEFFTRLKPIRE